MAMKLDRVVLDAGALSSADVVGVARHAVPVRLAPSAKTRIEAARKVVKDCLRDGRAHYGINTGFGSLAKKRIEADDLAALQRNLVRSHTAGAMEPLAEETARGMMLCLAASLARGHSGVRPVVVTTLIEMLNAGITPVVPSVGSVGASGDLAPLSAVALCMIGEGQATRKGRTMDAASALKAARIKPIELEAKEGLALINGTHLMAAEAAILIGDAMNVFDAAVIGLGMSIDACRASHSYLDHRLYKARNHIWAGEVANQLQTLLARSEIRASHLENDPRVQDPYSLRAGPTVLGAVLEQLHGIQDTVDSELGAVTDNPLIFPSSGKGEDRIVSGANFHGMPIALPLDFLTIAVCHLAGISERRSYLLTGAFEPESRLKPFLAPQPGLQSGLMIAQYTAAACVNEIITLSHPATVNNIPTCAGMEDYNSYGPRAAAKARRAIALTQRVIAIEMICAAAGLDCHRPLQSGAGIEDAYRLIRRYVKKPGADRPLNTDIERLSRVISGGEFAAIV